MPTDEQPQSSTEPNVLFFYNLTFILETRVRLVGGSTPSEGRVEVYHRGEWGTVCDDLWDINDGHVVCRELGYYGAERVLQSAEFGQGTGKIWYDDVDCIGDEANLRYCSRAVTGSGINSCSHSEDAGVQCIVNECKLISIVPLFSIMVSMNQTTKTYSFLRHTQK